MTEADAYEEAVRAHEKAGGPGSRMTVSDARAELAEIVAVARDFGDATVLTKHGRPVARVVGPGPELCAICVLIRLYNSRGGACEPERGLIPSERTEPYLDGYGADLFVCKDCHPQVVRYGDAITARRSDTVRYPVCEAHADNPRGVIAVPLPEDGGDDSHPHATRLRHYHFTHLTPKGIRKQRVRQGDDTADEVDRPFDRDWDRPPSTRGFPEAEWDVD